MDNLIYKIKLLRKTEKLKQLEFSELTGVSIGVIKKIDSGKQETITASNLIKIINHPRFKKYSMWLTKDDSDTSDISAWDLTPEGILKETQPLPTELQEQAKTMIKMLALEQKTNLIAELSRQVEELQDDD